MRGTGPRSSLTGRFPGRGGLRGSRPAPGPAAVPTPAGAVADPGHPPIHKVVPNALRRAPPAPHRPLAAADGLPGAARRGPDAPVPGGAASPTCRPRAPAFPGSAETPGAHGLIHSFGGAGKPCRPRVYPSCASRRADRCRRRPAARRNTRANPDGARVPPRPAAIKNRAFPRHRHHRSTSRTRRTGTLSLGRLPLSRRPPHRRLAPSGREGRRGHRPRRGHRRRRPGRHRLRLRAAPRGHRRRDGDRHRVRPVAGRRLDHPRPHAPAAHAQEPGRPGTRRHRARLPGLVRGPPRRRARPHPAHRRGRLPGLVPRLPADPGALPHPAAAHRAGGRPGGGAAPHQPGPGAGRPAAACAAPGRRGAAGLRPGAVRAGGPARRSGGRRPGRGRTRLRMPRASRSFLQPNARFGLGGGTRAPRTWRPPYPPLEPR